MKNLLEKIENILVAASFAEANAHDTAREYMGATPAQGNMGRQLQNFLEDIGLQDVPVTYGIARL